MNTMTISSFVNTVGSQVALMEAQNLQLRTALSQLTEVKSEPIPPGHSDVVLNKQTHLQAMDYLAERLRLLTSSNRLLTHSLTEAVGIAEGVTTPLTEE